MATDATGELGCIPQGQVPANWDGCNGSMSSEMQQSYGSYAAYTTTVWMVGEHVWEPGDDGAMVEFTLNWRPGGGAFWQTAAGQPVSPSEYQPLGLPLPVAYGTVELAGVTASAKSGPAGLAVGLEGAGGGGMSAGAISTPKPSFAKSYALQVACEFGHVLKAGNVEATAVANLAPLGAAAVGLPARSGAFFLAAAAWDIGGAWSIREKCVEAVYGPGAH